jgi:hypothetical protein
MAAIVNAFTLESNLDRLERLAVVLILNQSKLVYYVIGGDIMLFKG